MGRGNRLQVRLSSRDRQQFDELLSGGLQPVHTVMRALALRQSDQGQSTLAVGTNLGLSAKAAWRLLNVDRRGQDGGVFLRHGIPAMYKAIIPWKISIAQ
jgi:hypothetical protein